MLVLTHTMWMLQRMSALPHSPHPRRPGYVASSPLTCHTSHPHGRPPDPPSCPTLSELRLGNFSLTRPGPPAALCSVTRLALGGMFAQHGLPHLPRLPALARLQLTGLSTAHDGVLRLVVERQHATLQVGGDEGGIGGVGTGKSTSHDKMERARHIALPARSALR